MFITIGGKRYEVAWHRMRNDYGRCDPPTRKNKQITFHPAIKSDDQLYMRIVIHEIAHAAGWPIDEECVNELSTVAADTLYKLGFRRTEVQVE